jgi:imidazoleglycerol phosphate synthase glutamine amidotransferase subunit HisH
MVYINHEGNEMMNVILGSKKQKLPTDAGRFQVLNYDADDELQEASKLIFPTRGAAQQYMDNHVDPRTDPFIAEEKESKTNGNQKGKDAHV